MTVLGARFRFGENEEDDDLIGEYATPQDKERMVRVPQPQNFSLTIISQFSAPFLVALQKGQKRIASQTTPTTPASKSRHIHDGATPIHRNGVTPTTPTAFRLQSEDGSVLYCHA